MYQTDSQSHDRQSALGHTAAVRVFTCGCMLETDGRKAVFVCLSFALLQCVALGVYRGQDGEIAAETEGSEAGVNERKTRRMYNIKPGD